jgi:myo-inositol-1(or 4)-monophosphatase
LPGDEAAATDLPLLLEACAEASRIAMRHWRADPRVRDKGCGQGPVTEADLAIDATLRAALTAARPGYGWLSEESEDDPARLTRPRVFVLDPIDGTRAFVEGSADFAVSLAVVEDGVPVAGVVAMPAKGRAYAAARGAGATRDGAPMAVTGRAALDGAEVLATKANFRPEHWAGTPPPVTRRFRSSLAYRLARVAEGRADAMLTLRPAWEWDIAAGALLVAEARGQVCDRTGAALRFNSADRLLDGVIAGAPAVARGLVDRLARGG